MNEKTGILAVSHSAKIVQGLQDLVDQVAKSVPAGYVGGLENGEIGTSFEAILKTTAEIDANVILAFYDLGSARMNLEMVQEMTAKKLIITNAPLVEGTYAAAALLEAGAGLEEVQRQLSEITITK